MEGRDRQFLGELEALTVEQWLTICRRFTGDEKNIRTLARKAAQAAASLLSGLERIDQRYWSAAARKVQGLLDSLPEHMVEGGDEWPVRSLARGAIECGRCAIKLLDERAKAQDRKKLATPLLRPFRDLVTLPSLDFNADTPPEVKPGTGRARAGVSPPGRQGIYHLGFEEDYFTFTDPPPRGVSAVPLDWHRKRFFHETWELPRRLALSCRFGGACPGSCVVCGTPHLHHLITLPVLPGSPLSDMKETPLVTCLSCLGTTEPLLYFTHREQGSPRGAFYQGPVQPCPSRVRPLRETQVHLCETPSKWASQKWEDSPDQNLHRIGGSPGWVQQKETIRCPGCRKTMAFLLQLDSPLPLEDGARWLWGSGGVLYIFWCDRCKVDAQFYQDS